jgi:hypothetical protein
MIRFLIGLLLVLNLYGSSSEDKAFLPYLVPHNSPLKTALDTIFTASRATQDLDSMINAGFDIFSQQKRSFIIVASHPLLEGYLIKTLLDTEHRIKRKKPYYHWFSNRLRGAEKIRSVIKKKKFVHFKAPKKWAYKFPDQPSPPNSPEYQRKNYLIVVENMNLVPFEENLLHWQVSVTTDLLDEFGKILDKCGGSSLRPDNIWFSYDGKVAFIDTEYPGTSPDWQSIIPYLSADMKAYWMALAHSYGWE